MRAALVGLYSPDLPEGYNALPPDPGDCWIVVQADIRIDPGEGMDCFTCYVTTPRFLGRSIQSGGCQFGRGLLVVNTFDWHVIEKAVQKICEDSDADSSADVMAKVSRYLLWEYEDYGGS